MNSNWSYSPETVKLGCDPWPWPLTSDLDLLHGRYPGPWWLLLRISWWYNDGNIVKKVWQTDRQTDRQITRQIWGIWKLRPAYSLETPNLGQNGWCFVPWDLEIWWMTLENNRASLRCSFKLCATFHSHWWIQAGVTVRKRPIWVKCDDF